MAGDPWAEFEEVRPVAAGGGDGVYRVPDPMGQARMARDDAGAYRDETRTDIAVRDEGRVIDKQAFDKASGLREAYSKHPQVQAYEASVPMFVAALKTDSNLAGDQLLITSFAKLTDPTTGVLGGEREGVASGSQSWIDQKTQELTKILSSEGGTFSTETRESLRRQLVQLMAQRGNAYKAQRERYIADANAYGVDPARVVGPNVSDAERQFVVDYFKPDGAREPVMRGGVPADSKIKFGMDAPMDGPKGGFDHNEWLKTLGLDPSEEAEIAAFWNANSGNKDFTISQAKKWFAERAYGSPTDADLAGAVRDARRGARFGGQDDAAAKAAYEAKLDAEIKRRRGETNDGAPGIMDLATQGMSGGLGDEARGVGGAISSAVGLTDSDVGEGYSFERDLRRRELEQAREREGMAGTAVEFLGNAASMGATAATALPQTTRAAVTEGALAGGVAGFGYGEGAQDSLTGAAIGGTAGAALGKLFHGIGNRPPPAPKPGAEVIQAADRLNAKLGTNIAPIPADVAGATVRRVTGGAAQLPLSAGSIVNAGKAVNAETQAARTAIANDVGSPAELEIAGQSALAGAQKWMKKSKTKVDALYTKARKEGGDIETPLPKAIAALDRNIEELAKTPGGAKGLDDLKTLRAEIEGNWTVEGIKGMRTQLRNRFIDNGLRNSDLERRVDQVVRAADDDIADGLAAAGRVGAATAYKTASKEHAERVKLIDNVLAPIIGKKGDAPKSGEAIMTALDTATKNNNARLASFMRALPDEDAATVRATMISELGRANKGTQNAAGDAFSLGQFLTHWNAMTPGAKRTLFSGESRAALDDLAKVAEGSKEASRFANHSNTGSVQGMLATGGGGGAGFMVAPLTTTALLASQYGAGRLLASPGFARWLANAPAAPGAQRQWITGLGKVASSIARRGGEANTAVAADALGLQRQLLAAFEGPTRAAADEPTSKTSTTAGAGQ